ncbi:TPA: hypothetical protein I7730_00440 [Vibrio vulnificus]|uniref:Uncharacterized protein n=1 Tax=Vibrio vulnificus TaxID=672 RepID=A0A8H9K5I1_VIBVL|nr:hypothetical protein [Vibrio vulnificus]
MSKSEQVKFINTLREDTCFRAALMAVLSEDISDRLSVEVENNNESGAVTDVCVSFEDGPEDAKERLHQGTCVVQGPIEKAFESLWKTTLRERFDIEKRTAYRNFVPSICQKTIDCFDITLLDVASVYVAELIETLTGDALQDKDTSFTSYVSNLRVLIGKVDQNKLYAVGNL